MRSPAPANLGGEFDASKASDAVVEPRPRGVAALVGAEADEIVIGPSTTNLMFSFTRALAQHWGPGDRIVCTQLDHDSNVSPWLLAARDSGATVEMLEVDPVDGTLDVEPLKGCAPTAGRGGSRSPAPRTSPVTRRTSRGRSPSRTSTARGSSSTVWPACRTCRPTPRPRGRRALDVAVQVVRPARRRARGAQRPARRGRALPRAPRRLRRAVPLGDRDDPDRAARRHHRRGGVHDLRPRSPTSPRARRGCSRCCRKGCTRCPASPCTGRRSPRPRPDRRVHRAPAARRRRSTASSPAGASRSGTATTTPASSSTPSACASPAGSCAPASCATRPRTTSPRCSPRWPSSTTEG